MSVVRGMVGKPGVETFSQFTHVIIVQDLGLVVEAACEHAVHKTHIMRHVTVRAARVRSSDLLHKKKKSKQIEQVGR
jgi:hypothetical protein